MKFKVGDKVRRKDWYGDTRTDILEVKEYGTHNYKIYDNYGTPCWAEEKDLELYKEEKKMGDEKCCADSVRDNRGLYEVVVVNPTEDGEVILEQKVVARDTDEAKMLSNLKEILKQKQLRLGAVDIIVSRLGIVRPYETEQKVKIVGGIDGYKLIKQEK